MMLKNKRYIWYGVLFVLLYMGGVLGVAHMVRSGKELPRQAELSVETPQPMPSLEPSLRPTPTPSPEPPVEVVVTTAPVYIVKEENGVICVFLEGESEPKRMLNINPDNLRQYDKERFVEGFVVYSTEELAQLEEDFSS